MTFDSWFFSIHIKSLNDQNKFTFCPLWQGPMDETVNLKSSSHEKIIILGSGADDIHCLRHKLTIWELC